MHLQNRLSLLVFAALVSMATGCATSTDSEEPPVNVERNEGAEKDPPPPAVVNDPTSIAPKMRAVCRWMTCSDVAGEQGYRCWVCY